MYLLFICILYISLQVSGKIVVYNQEYVGYSDTSIYRREGAARAARYGAIASLTRSVTDFSIYSPHTGSQVRNNHFIFTIRIM